MVGEQVEDREAYDVLQDLYKSPSVSPKKKTLIESFEIGHTKRKNLEFIRDVNKQLLIDRQILQIPGWKNGGKLQTLDPYAYCLDYCIAMKNDAEGCLVSGYG